MNLMSTVNKEFRDNSKDLRVTAMMTGYHLKESQLENFFDEAMAELVTKCLRLGV